MRFSHLLFSTGLFLAGCAVSASFDAGELSIRESMKISEMKSLEDITPEMAGFWLSNGYGELVKVDEDGLELWQHTPEFCYPTGEDSESFTDYIDSYHLSDDKKTLRVGISVEQHTYEFTRLGDLPSHCMENYSKSPIDNFEVFVSYMSNHYAFFDLHGVNWDAEVVAAREKVSEEMSETELFDLMAYMMRDLEDSHLGLSAEIDGEDKTFNPDPGNAYSQVNQMATDVGEEASAYRHSFRGSIWHENIADRILGGKGELVANNRIQYGLVDEDIGYFAAITMGLYSEDGGPIEDIGILDEIMNKAVDLYNKKDVKAVIIDNSVNHGGYDFISRQMASHFADQKTKIYSKRPAEAEAPYKTQLYLEPSDGSRFTGPVYVLNSDMSVSAGEIFVMSLDPLPNVTTVGEPTRGALSDILAKTLPNGWELGISNEIYLDYEGTFWEDRGIEPDWPLDVFANGKLAEGHAAAVQKIVDKIRSE